MKIDVSKILELEYLNSLVLDVNNKINELDSKFISLNDIDSLRKMNKEDIITLFNQYGVSCENVLQFLESDFIDDAWEYADLFQDDISHSTELRELNKASALNEINSLNDIINEINNGYQKEKDILQQDLDLFSLLISIISKQVALSEENIDKLNLCIINSTIDDNAKYMISYEVVKFLIESNKEIKEIEKTSDTSSFEQELDEVYRSVDYEDEELEITEPVYPETIVAYYKFYKDIFNEAGLGDSLTQIMDVAHDLSQGININLNSIPKIDFCIELAALLYALNNEYKKSIVDQEVVSNLLVDLGVLDRRYEEDNSLSNHKNELLEKINNDLATISLVYGDSLVVSNIINRLSLLQKELVKNLINSKRKDEIASEYNDIKNQIERIALASSQQEKLVKLKDKIIGLLSSKSISKQSATDDYYLELTNLQSNVLELIDKCNAETADSLSLEIKKINEELSEYVQETPEKEKVTLQGFVLFDFDEENNVYVVDDLDPNGKNNFIDDSIEKQKVCSSFSQYSSLINDLLFYGEPGIIKNDISTTNVEKILNYVFFDPNSKKNATKMVRIRPHNTSLIRFVGQKFVFVPGTKMFDQVSGILQEILPNVAINSSEKFSIYINFASSLKRDNEDVYGASIHRYNRVSPLYRLLLNMSSKDELTDEECALLKDFINMSLEAYSELENRNEYLNFSIIEQIGGKRTRA